MPLMELWASNPSVIAQFTVEQVVAASGAGDLRDNSACSSELRRYLSEVPSPKLAEYVDGCLSAHFQKGGMVLQDLINELGRRLEYKVTNGRYQGTVNSIGCDGIWLSPEGPAIVTEVKTTDAYRISLDTVARYREKLVENGEISRGSSVLIVVGRQDTGELEAQIRGSRHAWDMRLISADALIKLVQLKENAEGAETAGKIRSLLVPREYTRLDDLVDVMFTTARDVETGTSLINAEEDSDSPEGSSITRPKGSWEFTDPGILREKRSEMVAALGRREGATLLKKSPALYWSTDHEVRAAFTISKRYQRKAGPHYWYAWHRQWDEFLAETERGYLVLGCVDRDEVFVLPLSTFSALVPELHTTTNADGSHYWHIQLTETALGGIELLLPKRRTRMPLSEYALRLHL